MALVKAITKDDRNFRSLHPTQVECRYLIAESNGKKVLQLNTYGSADREIPDKLSQTLQFDERGAADLFSLLEREFGFSTK
ncbi:MAG: hypothetical protein JJU15_13770 [Pararhodobacter sp.]|nr:hypothetical protein [Pararhodobacter sp.]